MTDLSPSLSAEELLAWNDRTTLSWHSLLEQHPEILEFSCDIYREASSVADLLQHIVAVELRYAQRLAGLPETPYEQIPSSPANSLLLIHQQAFVLLRRELATPRDWSEKIEFKTRTHGAFSIDRKTILFHALLHGIRHYAQLATIVRQHGFKPDWPMDYLFMGIEMPSESK